MAQTFTYKYKDTNLGKKRNMLEKKGMCIHNSTVREKKNQSHPDTYTSACMKHNCVVRKSQENTKRKNHMRANTWLLLNRVSEL